MNTLQNSSTGGDFADCTNLEYVDLFNITNAQGGSGGHGHFGYTKIREVILPNVTHVGQTPFKWSTSSPYSHISIVVLGGSLKTISNMAFNYTPNCSIFIYASSVPTFSGNLQRSQAGGTYIYVPDELYDDYKNTSTLSIWTNYIRRMSEYAGDRYWEELYPEELGLT